MTTIVIETNAPEIARQFGLTAGELRGALKDTMKTVARETQRDFRRTTATWHHKPIFDALLEERPEGFTVLVGTDDKIYGYVDQGTWPHFIFPRKAGGKLAFQTGYRAKTRPGMLHSFAGGSFGPRIVRPWVEHPGTEPRHFSDIIQAWQQEEAVALLNQKIRRIVEARGWGR